MDKWKILEGAMVLLALAGTFIIARERSEKQTAGFWCWTFANIGLVVVFFRAGLWLVAALYVVYLFLSVYGIWRRRGDNGRT